MRCLLLLAVVVAGCGPSVVAVARKPELPKPTPVAAVAEPPAADWSGDPLPPGMTPRGWIVTITSDGGGFKNRYAIARDPATPNSEPGGWHGPVSPSIGVKCSPTYSEVIATAGGHNWNATGKATAPGGTSFTASGYVREQGQPDRPFTAEVVAVP